VTSCSSTEPVAGALSPPSSVRRVRGDILDSEGCEFERRESGVALQRDTGAIADVLPSKSQFLARFRYGGYQERSKPCLSDSLSAFGSGSLESGFACRRSRLLVRRLAAAWFGALPSAAAACRSTRSMRLTTRQAERGERSDAGVAPSRCADTA